VKDLFADANEVSDWVYEAALDAAVSAEETAFRDVLIFHRDFLNGGMSQALRNQFEDLDRYVAAYRTLRLKWLADMIVLASTYAQDGKSAKEFKNADVETLGSAYCAATYGLAYASYLRDEIELKEDDAALRQAGDSVERMALRFARANRDRFQAILAAAH
jgi:hypothetical protein